MVLISGHNPKALEQSLNTVFETRAKSSFINFVIDEVNAAAVIGTILVVGVIGFTYAAITGALDPILGNTDPLDDAFKDLQAKADNCSRNVRAINRINLVSGVTPGEQETWDEMKKIKDHIQVEFELSHKRLHPYVLKDILGVKQAKTCKEFAELWAKSAGSRAKKEQALSETARFSADKKSRDKTRQVCNLIERYSDCLSSYKKHAGKFNDKKRGGKNFNSNTGRFQEESLWDKLNGSNSK